MSGLYAEIVILCTGQATVGDLQMIDINGSLLNHANFRRLWAPDVLTAWF